MNDTTLRTVFLIAEEIGEGGRGGDSGRWGGGEGTRTAAGRPVMRRGQWSRHKFYF